MSKFKARRILAILGGVILVIGGYIGWQVYQGQALANQYLAEAQKSAEGTSNSPRSGSTQTQGIQGTTPGTSAVPAAPTSPSSSQNPASLPSESSGSQPNSSAPSSEAYKQLMASTYQQTLQSMQEVKTNTLALQAKTLSPAAYKASILQALASFSAAEKFARANPPSEARLSPSYQEFLAGISLAKESMNVVLNGIASYSPSSLYAAREMGKTAQQQVISGYSHF